MMKLRIFIYSPFCLVLLGFGSCSQGPDDHELEQLSQRFEQDKNSESIFAEATLQRSPANTVTRRRTYKGVEMPKCENMTRQECKVFDMTNMARIRRSRKPLKTSRRCLAIAKDRAQQWASVGSMLNKNHLSPKGELPDQTAKRHGLRSIAENVALGYRSAKQVMLAWKRSEEHWRGMMTPKYTHTGIAHVGRYWFTCFSIERSAEQRKVASGRAKRSLKR